MRRFIFITVIFFSFINCANCAIDDNLDYDLNNAFSNPNPTTNQQFEDVMKQYEQPKREGLFKKLYRFFDSDKAKYDEAFKKRYENPNNQPTRIKDVPEDKPTVLISANSTDSSGNSVTAGYYQISFKKDENDKYTLELTEGGNRHVATLKAHIINEDDNAPSVVYARAQALDNGFIKVIYSNLDLTLIGYLKIVQNKIDEFEPLY